MPIYEYICSNCECKFEQMRPMSQATEAGTCPNCGNSAQRVLSPFCRSSKGEPSSVGASSCGSCSSGSCGSCSH